MRQGRRANKFNPDINSQPNRRHCTSFRISNSIVKMRPPVAAAVEDPGCARCINWKTHTKAPKTPKTSSAKGQIESPNGFDEGLELEAILGTRDSQQGIFYLVKWKDREDLELIPALLTFFHAPSLVIHFYANRISWIAPDS